MGARSIMLAQPPLAKAAAKTSQIGRRLPTFIPSIQPRWSF
jgi:hypothetical protein